MGSGIAPGRPQGGENAPSGLSGISVFKVQKSSEQIRILKQMIEMKDQQIEQKELEMQKREEHLKREKELIDDKLAYLEHRRRELSLFSTPLAGLKVH